LAAPSSRSSRAGSSGELSSKFHLAEIMEIMEARPRNGITALEDSTAIILLGFSSMKLHEHAAYEVIFLKRKWRRSSQ